jgi:hypothetical protein
MSNNAARSTPDNLENDRQRISRPYCGAASIAAKTRAREFSHSLVLGMNTVEKAPEAPRALKYQ